MGGICDNSLSVGDIYVHDRETRPLYVKFTMSCLMPSVFLGLKNSFSHKINSSCSAVSFWALQRTALQVPVTVAAPGGCGAGDPRRDGAGCCSPWARGSRKGCLQRLPLLLDWAWQKRWRGKCVVTLVFSESVFGSWEGAFISLFSDIGPGKNYKVEKKYSGDTKRGRRKESLD